MDNRGKLTSRKIVLYKIDPVKINPKIKTIKRI
jgi:hypothetical protein